MKRVFWKRAAALLLCLPLLAAGLLADGALIVMEHARGAELPPLDGALEICDTRRYGDTCLSLARRKGEAG